MERNSIGQFIAALRKANGMTQQEMADQLNVSNKAVSRWERDECAPDITLIPAIAEMFDVTCDELLRGQRVKDPCFQERKEPKVDKQLKHLINRTLSSFKTLIWISLTVSIVGFVCMLGISVVFYRYMLGFCVMLLFEICAAVLSVVAVSRTKDVKMDNELFESADPNLIQRFDHTLAGFSYITFFAIGAVIFLSLPFVIRFPISSLLIYTTLILVLILIFQKCKEPYTQWITETVVKKEKQEHDCSAKIMSRIQIVLTAFAGLIFLFAPYFQRPIDQFAAYEFFTILALVCLAANIGVFIGFLVRKNSNKKHLILPGIRNTLFIAPVLILTKVHQVSWSNYDEYGIYHVNDLIRNHTWYTQYIWLAVAVALLVYIIGTLADVLIKRMKK